MNQVKLSFIALLMVMITTGAFAQFTNAIIYEDRLDNAVRGAEGLLRFKISDAPDDFLILSNGTSLNQQFIPTIYGKHVSDNREAMILIGEVDDNNDQGNEPIVRIDARRPTGEILNRPLFSVASFTQNKFLIDAQGNAGFGTSKPDAKLTVAGDMHAQELRLDLEDAVVPDYVFKEDYQLRTLEEVESYVNEHSHLPEIPSAKEIEENGLMLKALNLKLLKKIEELTLYQIEQNKRINKLEASNAELVKQLSK